jgi:hypothetical protein
MKGRTSPPLRTSGNPDAALTHTFESVIHMAAAAAGPTRTEPGAMPGIIICRNVSFVKLFCAFDPSLSWQMLGVLVYNNGIAKKTSFSGAPMGPAPSWRALAAWASPA